MGTKLLSRNIYPELSSDPVSFLLGNVPDKIRIEIEFKVSTYALSTVENPFFLNAVNGYIGDGWVKAKQGNAFKDFRIGDTVHWVNRDDPGTSYADFTIIDKLANHSIQLDRAYGATPDDYEVSNHVFSVTTPVTGIRYRNNFIENSAQPSYISPISGAEILMSGGKTTPLDALVGSFQDMEWIGAVEHQIGSATIQGVSAGYYNEIFESYFKIIHYTNITPFVLAANMSNLIDGIRSPYFLNSKCLKYIYQIECDYDYNNPNGIQVLNFSDGNPDQLGNTGEYNENFNTGITKYSIANTVYTRADATVISALELTEDEQNVTFEINNTTDSPFSDNDTKLVLNFIKLIEDAGEYDSTGSGAGRTMPVNFCFDRKLVTCSSTPVAVNGDNNGLSTQVLKEITAEFINTTKIIVTFKVVFSAEVLAILQESETPRFALILSTQNHTLETLLADKVSLLVAARKFFIDTTDDGLIILNPKFLRHVDNDYITEGRTSLNAFPEDEVVAFTRMFIDKTGRTSDTILLKDVTLKIKAKNIVLDSEFDLDVFSLSLESYPLIGSGSATTQFIDLTTGRIFHIPIVEIRKNIKIKRRQDLDAGDTYCYDFSFPFLVRWEYWIESLQNNAAFFDVSEPINGYNNDWNRLGNTGNWHLFFEIKINASKNGVVNLYSKEKQFSISDYDSNTEWIDNEILSFENSTDVALYDSVANKDYILGYADTRIEASFTSTIGVPDIMNTNILIGIQPYERGGIGGKRRMSSLYPSDSDTWFKSTTTTYKVVTSVDTNTITGKAIVDYTKLPNEAIFSVMARLYSPSVIEDQKQFQDDEDFEFMDGEDYKFMDEL